LDRSDLGIGRENFLFLSTQSIYKYLPQHDDIYPWIAKKAPNARFVFIRHQSQHATQRFHDRLRAAFSRHRLDADRFCFFAPRMTFEKFLSLNMTADALLDTFDWSGGKTTLEAITCGLPVVTCPGRFMRGRHAYAMLTMMGITDTVANNPSEYCQIAIRLASDRSFYNLVQSKFKAQRHRLFNDKSVITELEKFYHDAAGIIYQRHRAWPQAIAHFKKALDLKPDFTEAAFNLANALKANGNTDKAIFLYQLILDLSPDLPDAHYQQGVCYLITAQPHRASVCFQKAVKLAPENAQYWFRAAEAHMVLDQIEAALTCYRTVIKLQPNWDAAHYNLAVALRMAECIEQAIQHAQHVIRINPNHVKVYPFLFRLAQHACDWPLVETVSKRLDDITGRELEKGRKTTEPPLTHIRRKTDPQSNMKVARSWSRHIAQSISHHAPLPGCMPHTQTSGRIRLGYLSSDFKDHAVAYQIKGLLENHNRNHFKIYGYACNPDDGSPYRQRLAEACDHFLDVHTRTNESIARQIQSDGIQILIDMAGHSKNNRLGIAAMRPAPVQVSYLGFLSSTGADFIDYVLADPIVIADRHAPFYTENIVYLPHCYQANDDTLPVVDQSENRIQWNLPEKAFVYCSFNQPYKIDADLFQTWMNILNRVEKSVLWLVERSGPARENLCRSAQKAGVDPKRLVFTGFVPLEQNLARLGLADLVLDTRIYNGGATTANALWAGVPILTILGENWVSRMSASALHAVGLPGMIAGNLDAYEKMAVDLALVPEKLETMRAHLQTHRLALPLFQTSLFTQHVEKAFTHMWQRYCTGLPPASFQVEPSSDTQNPKDGGST
jgi:predicted O-linked N-acetylglucosamine transferase (SPINDLY family)